MTAPRGERASYGLVFEHHILQALFHSSRRYSDGRAARAFSSQACVGDCPQPAYATGRLRDGDGRTIGATSKVEGRRTSDPACRPRSDVRGERASRAGRGFEPLGLWRKLIKPFKRIKLPMLAFTDIGILGTFQIFAEWPPRKVPTASGPSNARSRGMQAEGVSSVQQGRRVRSAAFAFWISQCWQARSTIRGTGVTERRTRGSLRLDVGCPDYFAPLLGIIRNKFAELGRRAGKHMGA